MTEDPQRRFERLLQGEAYACAWGYARRLTEFAGGARQDAEDLLQEALVQAWRGLAGLRDEARFKAWLLAIVRRRHLTRRQTRRPAQPLDETLPLPAPTVDPQVRDILEALSRLPQGPRELLSLFYLHGLTMSETAQVLGIAPRSVHMRLARAREALRRETARSTVIPRQECCHPARRLI
jgi:RNA polymerase sigma-70 factor (ECF subfamily)